MPLASTEVGGVAGRPGKSSKPPFVQADLALKECGRIIASVLQDQWDAALLAPFEVAGSAAVMLVSAAAPAKPKALPMGTGSIIYTPALCRGAPKLRQGTPA